MKSTIFVAITLLMASVLCEDAPVVKTKLLLQPEVSNLEKVRTKTLQAFKYIDLKYLRPAKSELPAREQLAVKSNDRAKLLKAEYEEEDLDEDDEEASVEDMSPEDPAGKVPVSTTVVSTTSYIDRFFAFLNNEKISKSSTEIKGTPNLYIDPTSSEGKLKTSIKSYGDLISDSKDLKLFTELLIKENSQEDDRYDDLNYKKYGPNRAKYLSSIESENHSLSSMDVDKFCSYLRSQGFSDEELGFLHELNLNYGFEEIERELNNIEKERLNKEPFKIIKIGGEDDIKNGGTRKHAVNLHNILLLLFIIYFIN